MRPLYSLNRFPLFPYIVLFSLLFFLSGEISFADYTEEQGTSLEWMTDSSQAIAIVEQVENGEYVHGWPMRIVRILKSDPRIEIEQVLRVPDRYDQYNPLMRRITFLHENEDGELEIRRNVGRDMHENYPGSDGIPLIGFDRDGRIIPSLDEAIAIVERRVARGPNIPEPDYSLAKRYGDPFPGGFYRVAERDFSDYYYMVLVPADPDFRPFVELESGLPVGYIRTGTLEENYPAERGPLSERLLDSPEATETMVAVLREIAPQLGPYDTLVHSRRASLKTYPSEGPTKRRSFMLSPDGSLLLALLPHGYSSAALLDASTGESLFTGEIFRFSPSGRYFITKHSDSAVGVRRSNDRSLVCELESMHPPLMPHIYFSPDERRVFFTDFQEDHTILIVYDLESGRRLIKGRVETPFFRIQGVYSESSYFLIHHFRPPGPYLFNWETGEYAHHFDDEMQLIEVSPDDETIAYIRMESLDEDERTPDVFTLFIAELSSRRMLREIELPCEPKELRFIADGEVMMVVSELSTREHRRNVALLYGVNGTEMDGETLSWTPSP
jgi:hypothetical protein